MFMGIGRPNDVLMMDILLHCYRMNFLMVIKITRIINLKYFCKDIVSEGIKTLFGFLPKGTVIGQIYIMDIDKDMICKY